VSLLMKQNLTLIWLKQSSGLWVSETELKRLHQIKPSFTSLPKFTMIVWMLLRHSDVDIFLQKSSNSPIGLLIVAHRSM